jgi:hypothetical protein
MDVDILILVFVELDNADLAVSSRVRALVVVGAVTTVRSAVVRIHLSLTVEKRSSVLGKDTLVLALTTNVNGGEFRERFDLRLNNRHRFD